MGSDTSAHVMALLAELSTLKALDRDYDANPQPVDEEAHRQRHQRHEEITRQIQALAEQEKDSAAPSGSPRG